MNVVNRFLPKGQFFVPATQFILSAVILLSVCNWDSIYEEDELAKTAQVIALDHDANWSHYSRTPDYYEKDLFSSYYLAATAFFKLSGLSALRALNLLSVLCGAIFLAVMPAFLRRIFGISPWLAWIALLSTPILVVTFSYGNEAAFAITLAALAAFALSSKTRVGLVMGGLLYTLAAYGRSDYLFLFPALALLVIVREGSAVSWRPTLRNLLLFTGTALVSGLTWLALVLHQLPRPDLFEYQTNLKLLGAFIVYSPNPVFFALAILGVGVCLATRRWKYFLLLPVLLQTLPYLTRLTSPKYILPSMVVLVIFALVGMETVLRRSKLALLLLLALPWLVSITPFGVFGPARSVFWYLPSDDGPIPTGGYLAFYAKVKEGFYQKRYDLEHLQIVEAMPLLMREPAGADLVGYLNHQSFRLWAVRNGHWEMSFDWMPFPFWDPDIISDEAHRAKFAIKTSYLYPFKQTPGTRAKLDSFYRDGRLKAVNADRNQDPFPDLVQLGLGIPPGTDSDLGRRILFLNGHYAGNHSLRRDSFLKDFGGVSWIPRHRFDQEKARLPAPIYLDAEWVCFSDPVPKAVYYSLRFPQVYARLR